MDYQEPSTSTGNPGKRKTPYFRKSGDKKTRPQRMAPTIESQYKDLLNPLKDPEKAFAVNISELLFAFVADVIEGRTAPNFNSAALLIQGSASVYAKKVEYLHNLATQLHNTLLKQKKNDKEKDPQEKKDTHKERQKKEDKLNDPFLSTEIKLGKNLSCLKRKNKAASKKATKKVKSSSAPVHLLMNDNDEKGDVFYDTRGEIVGNKGDFAMNKCILISSGWLLLPTVNPNLVPSMEAVPDYYDYSDHSPAGTECLETGDDLEPIHASPDDGFGSCPPSSDIQQSTPATEIDSQGTNLNSSSAVPMSVDEGIGDTPNLDDSPGAENVPADDAMEEPQTAAPQPVRQSVRQALKTCQLAIEDDPLAGITMNKELLKKKAIERKNVRRLPDKLKDNCPPSPAESITLYCARTFFSLDDKILKHSLLKFDTESFDQNSSFLKRICEKIEALKTSDKRNKNIAPIEDEREIDVEGLEVSRDANEDDETLCVPFDDNDIQIDHDPMALIDPPTLPEGDNDGFRLIAWQKISTAENFIYDSADQVPAPEMPSPDISHIAHAECENYLREVHQFVQNSDITERVHEWEKSVKPFLDEMEQRGSFDINMYGSQILNSFEDTTRKQTKTFRELCRNMEKWEIHRYFMAVLPLANIGNVQLDKEKKPDGSEEIFVTLLSRKMHHKELEEFGHNEGEHS